MPTLRKLGKLAPKHDPRTLKLAKYFGPALPAPPPRVNYSSAKAVAQPCGMMLNDTIGDCTCAAIGHAIQVWTGNASKEITVPDPSVLSLYELVTRQEGGQYDPSTGANDNGCACLDVLKAVRKTGIDGHKIAAFAYVGPANRTLVKQAIDLFGGVYIGLAMPNYSLEQDSWMVDSAKIAAGDPDYLPNPDNGHCVFVPTYDTEGVTVLTWSQKLFANWGFFKAYVDEAWVILSPDWVSGTKKAPSGFDLPTLLADLAAVQAAGGKKAA